MRLTVLGQHAKGLPAEMPAAAAEDDDPGPPLRRVAIETVLERIKHSLWHGNVVRALEEIEDLDFYTLLVRSGVLIASRCEVFGMEFLD